MGGRAHEPRAVNSSECNAVLCKREWSELRHNYHSHAQFTGTNVSLLTKKHSNIVTPIIFIYLRICFLSNFRRSVRG